MMGIKQVLCVGPAERRATSSLGGGRGSRRTSCKAKCRGSVGRPLALSARAPVGGGRSALHAAGASVGRLWRALRLFSLHRD